MQFDRAVRALRESLPASKYQVQITQPAGAATQAFSRRVLVINREFAVPRIGAETECIDMWCVHIAHWSVRDRGRAVHRSAASERPAQAPATEGERGTLGAKAGSGGSDPLPRVRPNRNGGCREGSCMLC